MNRIYLFILFGLLCGKSIGQEEGKLKDGYQRFRYPNGTISSEGLIKNGKPDGFWKSYYVTGIKRSEGKYTNFVLDSIWVLYDQTGDTIEKISYLYGKKNGWDLKYRKDPFKGLYVYSKELFAGSKKAGTAQVYYPDGKVQLTIPYNEGKKEGLSKEFDRDGNIITLYEYHNDFMTSRERINRIDNKGLKQGEWKEFFTDGKIKSESTYKDNLLHGYYKEYDTKGNLVLTMLYEEGAIVKSNVDDQPDIEIISKKDQDGKVIYSGPYRNKIPVGIHREFGKDGKVTNSYQYNNNGLLMGEGIIDEAGNRNGNWKDFYPDGKIQAEGQYNDNRRTGKWKFYNISGKVEQTGSYNNGRPDGLWQWYYESGTILREEEYFQGQRDGHLTEYTPTGEVITQGQYSDGERNGEWKSKTGEISEEGKYIMGLKDGIWRSFYPNGKLKSKNFFSQGNADGEQTFYYESGKVKEEQHYNNGIKEKTWKKFDEEGIPVLVIAYRNDTEVSINGMKIKLPENDTKLIQ
jgi:uncharacterized protein